MGSLNCQESRSELAGVELDRSSSLKHQEKEQNDEEVVIEFTHLPYIQALIKGYLQRKDDK